MTKTPTDTFIDRTARATNGYTLYQDADRVIVATGFARDSANAKTGAMIQVWVLTGAMDPVRAVQSGQDSLICGDCPLRGVNGFADRACYVNVGNAPLAIWRAWERGSYPYLGRANYPAVFAGRTVRWGAYGDPVYVPVEIVRWVSFWASGSTGYSHQWRAEHAQPYQRFLMASTDSEAEQAEARALGWRTFRVRAKGAGLIPGEISCPASEESGRRTTCEKCRLCNGSAGQADRRASISIVVHGTGSRNFVRIEGS